MENRSAGQDRLIIGISGASGVVYGYRALQLLRNAGVETHLVMTRTAELTLAYETTLKVADVRAAAMCVHEIDDMSAPIASGSYLTSGMIVAPCSIRSMSEIATGVTSNLLDPRRGCHPEGAPPARPDGPRNAAAYGPSAHHDCAVGDGRDHRAARPGLLCQAADARGYGRLHDWPCSGSFRDFWTADSAVGRRSRSQAPAMSG